MRNKILSLGLVSMMAISLVACGDSNDTKVIESGNTTTAASTSETKDATGYVFNYDGLDIAVDADMAPILEKLGEPASYFESPSCAAEGIGKLYTYNDFEIETYPDGDVDRVLSVVLKTDNVATAEGVDLSSLPEEIVEEYGKPTTESTGSMTYEKDGMNLVFIYQEDSLISIQYNSSLNK